MSKLVMGSLLIMIIILMSPVVVQAPEYQQVETVTKPVVISRGEPAPRIDRRIMRVTAYTNHDKGMNGLGVTANGELTLEGRTIAAPRDIPLGAQIYIPVLNHTYTVTDRGGAIKGNRLDLFIEDRQMALEFGVQNLEVFVRY